MSLDIDVNFIVLHGRICNFNICKDIDVILKIYMIDGINDFVGLSNMQVI